MTNWILSFFYFIKNRDYQAFVHKIPGILSALLISSALLGLYIEFYNRSYRGMPTPFLIPSVGLCLIGLFLLVKNRWAFIFLTCSTLIYCVFCLKHGFFKEITANYQVYYYQTWSFNTQTGRLYLKNPVGKYPPASGPYVSCSFFLQDWKSYLNNQPSLCTAFDEDQNIQMTLHDQNKQKGTFRSFQINSSKVVRKSLLGEVLDREAMQIHFVNGEKKLWPKFERKNIYQVYEQRINPQETRIVESLARDAGGNLTHFTESSLLNLSADEIYATYNGQGVLVQLPELFKNNFAFPAKIDVSRYAKYELPEELEGK